VREVVSNTSPLQYLFQADLLDLLPALYGTIVVPGGVVAELAEGRVRGIALPDPTLLPWVSVRVIADTALLQLATDLDRGEREVIAIAKQAADPLAILDDGLARRYARLLGIPFTGTLGVLLKAKSAGHLALISPVLDRLEALRFRFDSATRAAVLRLANE
jgi:predicted nucleic acid-binding protein